jgi:8-oxo-dGTP pyrophosphatase MutT (NUDIX family)
MVSAGGVVYRMRDGRMEVVLCGRREPHLWGLPKGTPDRGETLAETALREVREETGLDVEIQAALGTITYWFVRQGTRCRKTVYHNLMVPVGGALDRHDPEFDVVQWFEAEEACQHLTYGNEVKVLRRAMKEVLGDETATT